MEYFFPKLIIWFSSIGRALSQTSALIDDDDGINEILSQVGNDVLLSQVKVIDIKTSQPGNEASPQSKSTVAVSSKQNKLSKILEVMNLQKCNVTINMN